MFISHFKSLSGKARHQGVLTHDQEDSFTTEMEKRLPQRSPAPLAMPLASVLVTICLLLGMAQNAITTNKKRLTRRRQQQADDAHSSLIKLRGFGLSAGHFPLSHYAELFSETENDALSAIESSLFLVIGIMLFGNDICSLLPLYSTIAILVITYAILFLSYTAEYIISA